DILHTGPWGLGLLRAAPAVGAQVLRVQPQSAGARAGLEAGDFITSLGDLRAPTPAQVTRAFRQAPSGSYLVAGVERAGHPVVVAIARP
ncbi:MAG: PDZ domain-containing protein, partial [Acidobacteriota bacterium]|nr:PDZ domain-containing protein [Acidobacteriota bacterium]